jgi:hypothetical protein
MVLNSKPDEGINTNVAAQMLLQQAFSKDGYVERMTLP